LQVALVALHHGLQQELTDAAPLLTVHFDALQELGILLLIKMNASLLDVGVLLGLLRLGWLLLLFLVLSRALLSNQTVCLGLCCPSRGGSLLLLVLLELEDPLHLWAEGTGLVTKLGIGVQVHVGTSQAIVSMSCRMDRFFAIFVACNLKKFKELVSLTGV